MKKIFLCVLGIIYAIGVSSLRAQDLISLQYSKNYTVRNTKETNHPVWIAQRTLFHFDSTAHVINIESTQYLDDTIKYITLDSVKLDSSYRYEGGQRKVYSGRFNKAKCSIEIQYLDHTVSDIDGYLHLRLNENIYTYKFKYNLGHIHPADFSYHTKFSRKMLISDL
jgi:hypothetical protein